MMNQLHVRFFLTAFSLRFSFLLYSAKSPLRKLMNCSYLHFDWAPKICLNVVKSAIDLAGR